MRFLKGRASNRAAGATMRESAAMPQTSTYIRTHQRNGGTSRHVRRAAMPIRRPSNCTACAGTCSRRFRTATAIFAANRQTTPPRTANSHPPMASILPFPGPCRGLLGQARLRGLPASPAFGRPDRTIQLAPARAYLWDNPESQIPGRLAALPGSWLVKRLVCRPLGWLLYE